MNQRIKKVRIAIDLNQAEFAKRLGISAAAVSKIENGNNNPSDQTIILICKEFGVSLDWLRNGEGEMFAQEDRAAEIATIIRKSMTRNSEEDRNRMIAIIANMDDAHITLLSQILDDMFGRIDSQ